MDPLSLTASIIAIVGVGGQAAKTIKRLASIKGAPDLILALNNEIADMRLIIIAIQDVFDRQRNANIPPPHRTNETNIDASIVSALQLANEKVLKLDALHSRLASSPSGSSGPSATNKITWLREHTNLKLIQEDLRSARLKLAAALGVLNSSSLLRLETGIYSLQNKLSDLQSDGQNIQSTQDQRSIEDRTVIQGLKGTISNLQIDQRTLMTNLNQASDQQAGAIEALRTNIIDLQAYQQQVKKAQDQRFDRYEMVIHEPITRLLAAQQQLELKLDLTEATSIAEAAQTTASTAMQPTSLDCTQITRPLHISASVSQTKCSDSCRCVCHLRQTRQAPAFLSRFCGNLFIGYTGLPQVVQPCNVHSCIQRTSPMIVVTYFFPAWLLARALFLTVKLSSCDGLQFCLRVPRAVSSFSAIFCFARRGDVDGVKQVLQERLGSPFDCDSIDGYSPLLCAIFGLSLEVCHLLLNVGADPYQEDNWHRNAFDHAWELVLRKTGDARAQNRLRTLFPDEDYLDKQKFTLLHKALLGLNNLDLATLLASTPISTVDKVDENNRTAAWWAATRGDLSSLSLLIKHGADLNKATHGRSRPLDTALYSNRPACAKLLIESGHSVEYTSSNGRTPLHWCCYSGAGIDFTELLINKGANIEARTLRQATPLHFASQEDNTQLLKCLISHRANLNKPDILGKTPLHRAIQNNSSQPLQILLQHRADCSIRTKAGETLLHIAAQKSTIQCLAILCSFDLSCINIHDRITGTSPTQALKGLIGLTALEIAERRTDVTPEWLEMFRKLVHEVEFPESRASTDQSMEEGDDFEDALENQD